MPNLRFMIAAAAAIAMLTGCDRAQEERAAGAAADAVHKTNQALREAESSVKEGAREANQALRDVGATAKEGARDAARAVTDGGLTAKVKTALLAEPSVNGADVNVDTSAGVVTLRGNLADQAQVERVVAIARGIDGVKAVENQLKVARAG